VSDAGHNVDVRIRVEPEPSPAVMAAIVAAVRVRRSRQAAPAELDAFAPSRWALAGRREAMIARDEADLGPWDRR
jgi:hypothetical protein